MSFHNLIEVIRERGKKGRGRERGRREKRKERERRVERVIFVLTLFQIINESTTAAPRMYSSHTDCRGTS